MESSTRSTRPDVWRREEPNPERTAGGNRPPPRPRPRPRHQLMDLPAEPRRSCGFATSTWTRGSCGAAPQTVSPGLLHALLSRAAQHRRSGSGQDRDPGPGLYQAALAGDLVAMATALAQGAEVNRSFSGEEGRTALIAAAAGVNEPPVRSGPAPRAVHSDPLALLRRGHCWPASSCCSTAPTSTTET